MDEFNANGTLNKERRAGGIRLQRVKAAGGAGLCSLIQVMTLKKNWVVKYKSCVMLTILRSRAMRQLAIEELFAKLISYLEFHPNLESDRYVRMILNPTVSTVIVTTEGDVDATAYTNVFDRIGLLLLLDHETPPDTQE